MKRLLYHVLFWLAYFALRGFIEYLWLRGSLKGFSETDYVVAAWLAAFLKGCRKCFTRTILLTGYGPGWKKAAYIAGGYWLKPLVYC